MNNLTRNYSIVVILSNPSILIELDSNFEFWISEKQIAKMLLCVAAQLLSKFDQHTGKQYSEKEKV